MSSLLKVSPGERVTIDELKQNPWIQGIKKGDQTENVLNKMREWNSKRKDLNKEKQQSEFNDADFE